MAEVQYSPIFAWSLAQVQLWLSNQFKLYTDSELPVVLVPNVSTLRAVEPKLKELYTDRDERNGKIRYPFLLYAIGDISINTEKGGLNKYSGYRNIVTSKDMSTHRAKKLSVTPVKVGMGINFRTDNIDDLLALTHVLLMAAPRVSFVMLLDKFPIMTTLEIEPSVSIPQSNSDMGTSYAYETTLILNTYIGTREEIGLVTSIRFAVVDGQRIDESGEVIPEDAMDIYFSGDPQTLVKNTIKFTDFYNPNARPFGDTNVNG